MKRIWFTPAFTIVALAQQTAPPSFDVASVKVAEQAQPVMGPGGSFRTVMRGCRKPDPGMVNCSSATMKNLLMQAYGVKNYQVEGPAWIDSDTYDLMAKIPAGVAPEQVPAMLQALLAERFKVVIRKETRSLPAYELSIAKGGPKLKEVDPAEVAAFNELQQQRAKNGDSAVPPPPPPPPGGPGAPRPMPMGSMSMMMSSNGARTLRGKMTMPQLINTLSNQTGRPVVDSTGLKGTYEIELSFMGDENDPMMAQMRAMAPPPGAAGPGGDQRSGADANAPIATLTQAVQATLGLKLESKKMPLDMIILESANKVPTEN